MTTAAPAVDALVAGLLDDAAMFPPGNASLPDAVTAHAGHRNGPQSNALGPFVVPAARLGELDRAVGRLAAAPLAVTVTVPDAAAGLSTALAALSTLEHVQVRGVEVPLGSRGPDVVASTLTGFSVYAEVPVERMTTELAGRIGACGMRVKLRTGGADASAFPSEAMLAGAVGACVAGEVAFKCTAGLHRAVRHRDPVTGFEHHGFLNVLLATSVALDGAGADAIATQLGARSAVADRVAALGGERIAQTRRWFRSFGTCSITEPLDDLRTLGLLAPS